MITKLNSTTKAAATLWIGIRHAALSILLTSCAASAPTIVHDRVGPGVARGQDRNGFLTVYSATAWISDADGPSTLRHTDYEIETADGTRLEMVRNGEDEPARVLLREGSYVVEAQSDTAGTVRVPVAIEGGRTTILHLERERDWNATSGEKLVRLPNGQPIGVRAAERRKAS